MIAYRVARKKHIEDLSGEGAYLFGGRWNPKGERVVYLSRFLSLAVLEVLVHAPKRLITGDYYFAEVSLPDRPATRVTGSVLPQGWREVPAATELADIGSRWINENRFLTMQVPSAVLPYENNILLNPSHPHAEEVKIVQSKPLLLDQRMVSP